MTKYSTLRGNRVWSVNFDLMRGSPKRKYFTSFTVDEGIRYGIMRNDETNIHILFSVVSILHVSVMTYDIQ